MKEDVYFFIDFFCKIAYITTNGEMAEWSDAADSFTEWSAERSNLMVQTLFEQATD